VTFAKNLNADTEGKIILNPGNINPIQELTSFY